MQARSRMISVALALALALPTPTGLRAQDTGSAEPLPQDTAPTEAVAEPALLTDEELRTLVGPIALYPDTLLIQILVSATVPFDVLKADRFLLENPDAGPDELSDDIAAQGWDESVEVLALGFPDVIGQMAEHIEWTETLGTAMLAQQEDLLLAVQDLREIASENGALQSNEAIEVTKDEDSNIIIVPATPEIVYVPQYQPERVYVSSRSNTVGNAVATGLVVWGTFVLVDAVFGSSYRYWGCRNCCGWRGGGIYNDINIEIGDNNTIIGNRPGDGWRPRPEERAEARARINDRRGPDGATRLPLNRPNRNDDLRRKLSDRTGATDISNRANRNALPTGNRASGAAALRERSREGQALSRSETPVRPGARPEAKPSLPTVRPQASRPQTTRPSLPSRPSAGQPSSRPAIGQPTSRPSLPRPQTSRAPVARRDGGTRARAHSTRGNTSRGGIRQNRR